MLQPADEKSSYKYVQSKQISSSTFMQANSIRLQTRT